MHRFGQRRVDHPLLAELLEQTRPSPGNSAAPPDVLAEQDDAIVGAHLLGERLVDRFDARFLRRILAARRSAVAGVTLPDPEVPGPWCCLTGMRDGFIPITISHRRGGRTWRIGVGACSAASVAASTSRLISDRDPVDLLDRASTPSRGGPRMSATDPPRATP